MLSDGFSAEASRIESIAASNSRRAPAISLAWYSRFPRSKDCSARKSSESALVLRGREVFAASRMGGAWLRYVFASTTGGCGRSSALSAPARGGDGRNDIWNRLCCVYPQPAHPSTAATIKKESKVFLLASIYSLEQRK